MKLAALLRALSAALVCHGSACGRPPARPSLPVQPRPVQAVRVPAPETAFPPPEVAARGPQVAPVEADDGFDAIADQVFGAAIEHAWSIDNGTFLLTRRGRPAVEHRGVLPYPRTAGEAASGGRVVTMAEVWTVRNGLLARVMSRPVALDPMVCDSGACTLVTVGIEVERDGRVALVGGTCDAALAATKIAAPTPSTYDVYDRAVVPAICKARGTYGWNGTSFVPSAAKPNPALTATLLQPASAAAMFFQGFAPNSLTPIPVKTWASDKGDSRFALFVHTFAAPHHAFFTHSGAAQMWESGRALLVAEIWTASLGAFRRVFRLPIGLAALAEPLEVVRFSVEIAGSDVRVGSADGACKPDSGYSEGRPLSPLERADAQYDQAAARRICAGRGVYHFNGRTFERAR